jgi:hypothetical protein
VSVGEQGTQSGRANADDDDLATAVTPRPPTPRAPTPRMPGSSQPRSAGYWPAVAIIAIVVATAGWTTVAVMALNNDNGGSAAAQETPAASDAIVDPNATDDPGTDFSDAPVDDSHDAPDLEALLPTAIGDTALSLQSWTGDSLLTAGDPWSDSVTAFLTSVGKTPADLSAAQAFDATESTDHSVGVFRLDGVATKALRDAMIAAWKESYPDLKVSTIKLDGTEVTKGDFGQDAIDSYWYEKDGLVYDIETSDEKVATTLVTGIRDGTFPTGAPASPAGSEAPSESPAPS